MKTGSLEETLFDVEELCTDDGAADPTGVYRLLDG